jgi:RNA polymerase sigma-70 factor (ECF subfamily)
MGKDNQSANLGTLPDGVGNPRKFVNLGTLFDAVAAHVVKLAPKDSKRLSDALNVTSDSSREVDELIRNAVDCYRTQGKAVPPHMRPLLLTSAASEIRTEVPTTSRLGVAKEAELVARAQQGDMEAFCGLAAGHQRKLYLLALKYTGNHHDAEDLTQDVMLNAYRAILQFRGLSSFRTWLSRIMVNSFLNHKHKSDSRGSSEREEPETIPMDSGNVERRVHDGLVMQQILKLLQTVPERQRLMFLMKHQEGMTCEEIAQLMGTSVGTVKKTLFRVVDRLRQHFSAPAHEKKGSSLTVKSFKRR